MVLKGRDARRSRLVAEDEEQIRVLWASGTGQTGAGSSGKTEFRDGEAQNRRWRWAGTGSWYNKFMSIGSGILSLMFQVRISIWAIGQTEEQRRVSIMGHAKTRPDRDLIRTEKFQNQVAALVTWCLFLDLGNLCLSVLKVSICLGWWEPEVLSICSALTFWQLGLYSPCCVSLGYSSVAIPHLYLIGFEDVWWIIFVIIGVAQHRFWLHHTPSTQV